MTSIYDFSVLDQDNQMISLDTYRGNVLLVVNTRSEEHTSELQSQR